MRRLGVGLVGANWAVRGHLPGWRMHPDTIYVRGICTRSPATARQAAEAHGLDRAYGSFGDMLDDPAIDIVSLGGPPPARYAMTMQALEAGKHVFSCIPFAVTNAQARAMAELQVRRGLVGSVDAYFRWTPAYSYLKDLLDGGLIGNLSAVNVDFSMSQVLRQPSDYAYRWTGRAENGTGVGPNSCAHVFHTLIHLFGPITEIIGETRQVIASWTFEDGSHQPLEVDDTAQMLARFANGATATIHAGRAVPSGPGLRIEAYGDAGRVAATSPAYPADQNVTLTAFGLAQAPGGQGDPLDIPPRYWDVAGGRTRLASDAHVAVSMGRTFADMITAIRTGREAQPSFARAAYVQSLVTALAESSAARTWQTVAPEHPGRTPSSQEEGCLP